MSLCISENANADIIFKICLVKEQYISLACRPPACTLSTTTELKIIKQKNENLERFIQGQIRCGPAE